MASARCEFWRLIMAAGSSIDASRLSTRPNDFRRPACSTEEALKLALDVTRILYRPSYIQSWRPGSDAHHPARSHQTASAFIGIGFANDFGIRFECFSLDYSSLNNFQCLNSLFIILSSGPGERCPLIKRRAAKFGIRAAQVKTGGDSAREPAAAVCCMCRPHKDNAEALPNEAFWSKEQS